ncbi:adiponectin receptor protein 2-like isoform X3 [Acipenser ruthenus]|uniref:adiponectin receptor protein 2-like isoform X3 n=1 Tax=Acipenser ruthenus TaxID=7906 RepID=UPI002741964C|nr:adiponectin receptor protein 2-like isoform X3 [Acipenser ruthenus]
MASPPPSSQGGPALLEPAEKPQRHLLEQAGTAPQDTDGGREVVDGKAEEQHDGEEQGGAWEEKEEEEEEEEAEEVDPVRVLTLPLQAHHAMEKMEEFVFKVWEGRWRVIPHDVLPDWLKDNDFLLHGHRPPMPSFRACFQSIFRMHTETGNIWTHLIGEGGARHVLPGSRAVPLLLLALPHRLLPLGEGLPHLLQPRLIYLVIICVLGITAIVVSQWDRFATPQYRAVRAGVFLGLGLSGLVPTLHFMFSEGLIHAITVGQIGWLFLMAICYILGVALYAARIPERFFPGRCDIWFHSHQIFHVLVVAGAVVHLHGVSQLQAFRSSLGGGCAADTML